MHSIIFRGYSHSDTLLTHCWSLQIIKQKYFDLNTNFHCQIYSNTQPYAPYGWALVSSIDSLAVRRCASFSIAQTLWFLFWQLSASAHAHCSFSLILLQHSFYLIWFYSDLLSSEINVGRVSKGHKVDKVVNTKKYPFFRCDLTL